MRIASVLTSIALAGFIATGTAAAATTAATTTAPAATTTAPAKKATRATAAPKTAFPALPSVSIGDTAAAAEAVLQALAGTLDVGVAFPLPDSNAMPAQETTPARPQVP